MCSFPPLENCELFSTLMSSPVCVWRVCVCFLYICMYKRGILMFISTGERPDTERLLLSLFYQSIRSLTSFCVLTLHPKHTPALSGDSTWDQLFAHTPTSTSTSLTAPQICSLKTFLFPKKYGHTIAPQLLCTWGGFKNDGNLLVNLISYRLLLFWFTLLNIIIIIIIMVTTFFIFIVAVCFYGVK